MVYYLFREIMENNNLNDGNCQEAQVTSLSLQIGAYEIDALRPDPSALTDDFLDGTVRLERRIKREGLAEVFLDTTIEGCETCALDVPLDQKECPNKKTLEFIRNVLL